MRKKISKRTKARRPLRAVAKAVQAASQTTAAGASKRGRTHEDHPTIPLTRLLAVHPCMGGLQAALQTLDSAGLLITSNTDAEHARVMFANYGAGHTSAFAKRTRIVLDPTRILRIMEHDGNFRHYALRMLRGTRQDEFAQLIARNMSSRLLSAAQKPLKEDIRDLRRREKEILSDLRVTQDAIRKNETKLRSISEGVIPFDVIRHTLADHVRDGKSWKTIAPVYKSVLDVLAGPTKRVAKSKRVRRPR